MKRVALFSLMLLLAGGAKAQLFSDNQLGGAVLGGVVGGVIGHNNNRQTAEGIGIGAGLGYLLGTLNDYDSGPRYSSGRTRISVDYGYGYGCGWGHRHFGHRHGYWGRPHWGGYHSFYGRRYYRPSWGVTYSTYTPAVVYTSPAYVTTPAAAAYTVPATTTTQTTVTRTRPNYALGGAAVGGLLGAVIGHNSDRQTAEGAAIGAGAGLLLGGIAEHNQRKREAEAAAARAAQARVAQQPSQPVATTASAPRTASLYSPGVVSGRTPVTQESTSTATGYQPVAPANYSNLTAANRLFGR
jgi:uncharacterized protein YcfJ